MATVLVYTKAFVDGILQDVIVSAEIDAFGHLILTTNGGAEIDAGGLPVPDASLTVKGIVELATDAETLTGTDTARAITPSNLTAKLAVVVVDASDTVKGIVELATSAETITGSDTVRAVTPAGLHAKVASDTVIGLVELATSVETITGSDTTRAVTPAGLHAKVASATAIGLVELATNAEAIAGTDTTRAVTPANLSSVLGGVQEDNEATSGNVTSTSYTPTLSAGNNPEITFVAPASGKVLIHWSSYMVNGASGGFTYMSWEVRENNSAGAVVSGYDANDARAITNRGNSAGSDDQECGKTRLIEGLTPGNTYYVRGMYRVTTNTGTYINRNIIIDPK